MAKRVFFAALIVGALGGCAINQTVKPVEPFEGQLVCVVENPAVKYHGFLEAYKRVLIEKGYAVRQLPSGTALTTCPITSTYTANWRWDLAMYLAFADIKVYKDGEQSGQATYNALGGGANLGKFIKGDTKVAELVDQLFPRASRNVVKTFEAPSASLRATQPTPPSPPSAASFAQPTRAILSVSAAQADVAANPALIKNWVNLGIAYRQSRQYPESERALNEATRRDAKSGEGWLELGRTLKESGQNARLAQIHKDLMAIDANIADEFFRELILPK